MELTPAANVEHKATKQQVIALAAGQPTYRVLVAEDNLENRKLLVKLLAGVGFEVREASNGQEAIRIWEIWQPHLIWMDMRMPLLDGYEATKQIKSKIRSMSSNEVKGPESIIEPIIIALTATAFKQEQATIRAIACDDFVSKPYQITEIFEKMATHLGVSYIYETELDQQKSEEQNSETLRPLLAAMPAKWLSNFLQAVEEIDLELAQELITQLDPNHQTLADALSKLVDDYHFDILHDLLEKK